MNRIVAILHTTVSRTDRSDGFERRTLTGALTTCAGNECDIAAGASLQMVGAVTNLARANLGSLKVKVAVLGSNSLNGLCGRKATLNLN